MRKKINWAGQKFNHITLIEPAETHGKEMWWKAVCDCGTEFTVAPSIVKSGGKKHCGCVVLLQNKEKWQDKKFGHLTLIKQTDKRIRGSIAWDAQCDCGNVVLVNPKRLKEGDQKSCGCKRFHYDDLSGQTLYDITFIKPTSERRDNKIIWEAICACGTIFNVDPMVVKAGGRKHCGCNSQKKMDFTNITLGKLTFIKATEEAVGGKTLWEAKCECGTFCVANPYTAKAGTAISCGCYRQELLKDNTYGENNRIYDPVISSARGVWKRYSDGCSFEKFFELSQLPCHYCGAKPSKTNNRKRTKKERKEGFFTYNGLDRVDNSKGHSENNIVPCCITCNTMKMAMPYDVFFERIKTIIARKSDPNFVHFFSPEYKELGDFSRNKNNSQSHNLPNNTLVDPDPQINIRNFIQNFLR